MSSSTLTAIPPDAEALEPIEQSEDTPVSEITERDRHQVLLILATGGTIELQILKAQHKRHRISSLDDLADIPPHGVEELRRILSEQMPPELHTLL